MILLAFILNLALHRYFQSNTIRPIVCHHYIEPFMTLCQHTEMKAWKNLSIFWYMLILCYFNGCLINYSVKCTTCRFDVGLLSIRLFIHHIITTSFMFVHNLYMNYKWKRFHEIGFRYDEICCYFNDKHIIFEALWFVFRAISIWLTSKCTWNISWNVKWSVCSV